MTVTSRIDAVEANFDSINTKLDKLDNILTLMEAFNHWRLLVDKSLLDNTRSVRELRSEERRVGKECTIQCRSRWSPYH